jgi:hypothetical protein
MFDPIEKGKYPLALAVLSVLSLSACDGETRLTGDGVVDDQGDGTPQTEVTTQTVTSNDGADGIDGTDGTSGSNGENGADGQDGSSVVVNTTGSNANVFVYASGSGSPVYTVGAFGQAAGDAEQHYLSYELDGVSPCLDVGEVANFELNGLYLNNELQLATDNLSAYASVDADVSSGLQLVSAGDNGFAVAVNRQGIVQMPVTVFGQTLSPIIGAVTSERPVILSQRTAEQCTFVLFGANDECGIISAGIDSGSGGRIIVGNDPALEMSVRNCTLSNPDNIPVIDSP